MSALLVVSHACAPHRPSMRGSQGPAVALSCSVGAIPRGTSSFRGKRGGHCPDADDNPPFVIQDMDLLSSLTFELSHSENPTPNCFKVGRQMALARQSRSIHTDQAELVIRHSGPSPRRPPAAKHSEATKVPPLADYLARGL